MKRLSSMGTFFYKKVFPVLWFGFLGFFGLMGIKLGSVTSGNAMFLVVPGVMAVFGYFIMRRFVWDLVDEVLDGGDYLVIRNRGTEYRVPLTDIMNVSSTIAVNPPRITLRLDGVSAQGPLGLEVTFSPEKTFTLNPFAKNAVAEDLIVRVARARSRRSR